MMKIAIIDNYDSFTYNIVHLVNSIIKGEADVFRNDKLNPEILKSYDGLILSPGPGIPDEAGLLKNIIGKYTRKISIFGVCLGMQAIAEVFGGTLRNLPGVFHGVATEIIPSRPVHQLFKNMPPWFMAGRYHSWIVNRDDLPDCLAITAIDNDGEIMALAHKEYNVCGVQFHPESVLTPQGKKIMVNWLGQE